MRTLLNNKLIQIMLLFFMLMGCKKEITEIQSYPLNFDFSRVGIQGNPFGWDFRTIDYLGFKYSLVDNQLSIIQKDSTDRVKISYTIPAIYLENKSISLSLPFKTNQEIKSNLDFDVQISEDFSKSNIIKSKFIKERSLLLTDSILITENFKDIAVNIYLSGPIDIQLEPIIFKVDGVICNQLPPVLENKKVQQDLKEQTNQLPVNSQLLPVLSDIGDHKYILLGESVHGAKAFHSFKVEITKEMMHEENDGVIIALEDDFFGMIDFMNSEEIEVETFKNSFYKVWESEEIFNFLKWLNEMNKSNIFFGVDIQQPNKPLQFLSNFFNKKNALIPTVLTDIENDLLKSVERYGIDGLQETISKISFSNLQLSRKEMLLAEQAKNVLVSAIKLKVSPSQDFRDLEMAKNLKWLAEVYEPNKKVVFWGHDGHIRINEGGMGGYLKQIVKDSVYSLSLQVMDGYHRAFGKVNDTLQWSNSKLVEMPNGSLPYLVSSTFNQKPVYLDFKSLKSNTRKKVLNRFRPYRSIGASIIDIGLPSWQLDGVFDGVVVFPYTESLNF